MRILPVNNQYVKSLPSFKSDFELGGEYEPDRDSRYGRYADTIGDEYHPIRLDINFHPNGKISKIDIDYKNSDYAEGHVTEEYDEDGKNLNYNA